MQSKPVKAIDADRSVPVANYHLEQTRFPKNHILRTQHSTTNIASKREEGRVRSRTFVKKNTFKASAFRSCRALLTLCQSSTKEEGDHYPRDLGTEWSSVSIDEEPSRHGTLKIAPLEKGDIGAASVVLTRSFATSPQGMVIDDVRAYIEKMLELQPEYKGLFLVGKLFPKENEQPSWLKQNMESRIVATAALSFHTDSRENFATLPPPENAAYLCNIAVDPTFRRQGYARRMLAACESIASAQGFPDLYLHLRLADTAARSLYESSGYSQVDADSWLIKLRGLTPSALMVKHLIKEGRESPLDEHSCKRS